MSYQIRLSKAIRNQLQNLPGHIRPIARERLLSLAEQPCPTGAKELSGHPSHYRLWIGGRFRLVWQIIEGEKIVDVLYIGPKTTDLYERLGLGRPE